MLAKPIQPAKKVWAEDEIFAQIVSVGKQFKPEYELQEQNRQALLNTAYYFLKDDRCQLDMRKGLMLMGMYGTGKTITMRIMQRWFINPFLISICKNVIDDYQSGGQVPATYEHLGRFSFGADIHGKLDRNSPIARLFDDLGDEQLKHPFQDTRNVMAEILSARYDSFVYLPQQPMITHITTNLPMEKLTEIYGHRLTDRFVEMFNIIIFEGKSLRK